MNVEALFFWIRVVARAILEVFPGVRPGAVGPEMKPERIQIWLPILARAALRATDAGGNAPEMKPERIQFWLQLIARFVLAVIAGANGETGKSGETTEV